MHMRVFLLAGLTFLETCKTATIACEAHYYFESQLVIPWPLGARRYLSHRVLERVLEQGIHLSQRARERAVPAMDLKVKAVREGCFCSNTFGAQADRNSCSGKAAKQPKCSTSP